MRFASTGAALALTLGIAQASPVILKRAVSQDVFNDLVFYFQYASSAYADACARPNGNTLIEEFSNAVTDTQGFIARDDNRKEIVVSLRGSTSLTDFLVDGEIALVPMSVSGTSPPAGTLVHQGFQAAWNSVASGIISTVRSQLAAHPGYSIVTSGHSLGGALSSLAGITMKQNFPNSSVRMFTYGQPRTGNPTYATFINNSFGTNAFRAVHTFDGVPTIIPQSFGYRHHVFEYWQNPDPASAATTKMCDSSGEDPTCSDSIPSTGINAAHLTYFNIAVSTTFCT